MWNLWWLGDAMGATLVTPLLLTCTAWRFSGWRRREAIEALLLLSALAVVGLIIFLKPQAVFPADPLAYAIFPFTIWAALRFGPPGLSQPRTFTKSSIAP